MLRVFLIGHQYEYEVKELLKLFYSINDIKIYVNYFDNNFQFNTLNEDIIVNKVIIYKNKIMVVTEGYINGENNKTVKTALIEGDSYFIKKKIKQLIKSTFFQLLTKNKKLCLPWGFLTGIRPTKIVHELMQEGKSDKEIADILTNNYYISQDKVSLLLEVAKIQHRYIYPIDKSKVSIYISIPFCPTRCSYCSFPSNPLNKFKGYIDDYVEALCKEIRETSNIFKNKSTQIETIYIGGGTPTTLNSNQFTKLLDTLYDSFNTSTLKEFTIEAGRPDTIDTEKLILFKKRGVTRISINPQTMNDCTLKVIGRNHSMQETIKAYKLAKTTGFDNINMDIIIGLPGEGVEMVKNTMNYLKELSPTNLTVHTLAIKNSSRLKEEGYVFNKEDKTIIKMLKITEEYARDMGLKPYYLYRQKHMVGNLENIGYSKPGYECIYNIQIMEEKQTIIAMGAGAVSKVVFPKENRLERVANVKNVEEYIGRVEEMIDKKRRYFF